MSGPQEIILHIGPPKTATTTIQRALARAQPLLRAQRAYAEVVQDGVFGNLYQQESTARERAARSRSIETFAASILNSEAERVIVSFEVMSWLNADSIRRVVHAFGADRVRVVIGVRSLADHIPSNWQEGLKRWETLGYRDWCRALLVDLKAPNGEWTPGTTIQGVDKSINGPRDPLTRPRTFWRSQDISALVARWGAALPPGRIVAFVVDAREPKETLLRAGEALGVGDLLVSVQARSENRSFGARSTESLVHFNRKFRYVRLPARLRQFFQQVVLEYLTLHVDNSDRITLPSEYAAEVAQIQNHFIDSLLASNVSIYGDVESLRPREATSDGMARASGADRYSLLTIGVLVVTLRLAVRKLITRVGLFSAPRHGA